MVLDRLDSLGLAPLSISGVAQLLDGTSLDPDQVHALTGGDPSFATEVAKDPHRPLLSTVPDVEALPYADNIFDVVTSCLGVMSAPHHRRGADEILRATRSGGRIRLVNWTPEGFVGQMFATMKAYAPPPPPGAQPPPLWGRPDHLQADRRRSSSWCVSRSRRTSPTGCAMLPPSSRAPRP